jgi:hypothetical protein
MPEELDPEIKSMLLEGEEILVTAEQGRLKPGGSITTPNKIYITNMRLLFKDPRLFGLRANIVDVNYVDISNVRLKRGILSTEIYLKSRFLSDEVRLPAVEKEVAQQVSGMIHKGMSGELSRPPAEKQEIEKAGSLETPMEKLDRIAQLKERGLITDEEFSKLKGEILKGL